MGEPLLIHLPGFSSCDNERCYASGAVLRVCASLFISFVSCVLETVFLNDLQAFFGFMSIIMIGHKPHAPSAPRVKFQNSYWILKITIFLFFLGLFGNQQPLCDSVKEFRQLFQTLFSLYLVMLRLLEESFSFSFKS